MPRALAVALLVAASCELALGDDASPNARWPRFLGPSRDGHSADARLVTGWVATGLRECWRAPIGDGYAGLAVTDAVYGMDKVASDEFIFARSLEDATELWRVRTGRAPGNVYGGLGPRVTPTVDGDRVFTVSAEGRLLALAKASGTLAWSRDLESELGWRPPAEGTASTPLVAEGLVFLVLGGGAGRAVGAFDRGTGETVWTAEDDRASYSSPTLLSLAGRETVLFLLGSELVALEPETGNRSWSYPWATYDRVNVATPILVAPNRVFISSGYDQGGAVLELSGGSEPRVVWRSRVMKNHFNNSVHYDGVLYGFDESILKAVDAASGELLWRARGFGKGSVVVAHDSLILLSDDGEIALAEPSRERLVVVDQFEVLDGRTWTPPSIADGRLYLRSRREIVCLRPGG